MTTIEGHLKDGNFEKAENLLCHWTDELCQEPLSVVSNRWWPFWQLAILYRKHKRYQDEIELLKRYVASHSSTFVPGSVDALAVRLSEVEAIFARYVPDRGKCEMCDKTDRALTRIDSGHVVCRTCLRELDPIPRKDRAKPRQIASLRAEGFDVPDNLTRQRYNHIRHVQFARQFSPDLSLEATDEEIDEILISVVKSFRTNVAGITHTNRDGSWRQDIICNCQIGEKVDFVREPDNPYDPRAVKVCRKNGRQIGYLKAEILGNDKGIGWCIADQMDKGITYQAKIGEIYSFEYEREEFLGVQLEINYHPYLIDLPDEPESA